MNLFDPEWRRWASRPLFLGFLAGIATVLLVSTWHFGFEFGFGGCQALQAEEPDPGVPIPVSNMYFHPGPPVDPDVVQSVEELCGVEYQEEGRNIDETTFLVLEGCEATLSSKLISLEEDLQEISADGWEQDPVKTRNLSALLGEWAKAKAQSQLVRKVHLDQVFRALETTNPES